MEAGTVLISFEHVVNTKRYLHIMNYISEGNRPIDGKTTYSGSVYGNMWSKPKTWFSIHFLLFFFIGLITGELFDINSLLDDTYRHVKTRYKTPNCTFDFLTKKALKSGQYFSNGAWGHTKWTPTGCEVPSRFSLPECLQRNNVNSVLVLGDSTAKKYTDAILAQLQDYGSCEVLKDEPSHDQQTDYFDDIPYVSIKRGECSTCTSAYYECQVTDGIRSKTTYLEYISMEHFMDSVVTTQRNSVLKNCDDTLYQFRNWDVACGTSLTTQEFIFNEYLPLKTSTTYPKIIIIVGNFHDMTKRNVASFERTLAWFMDVVKQGTLHHRNTKIIWFEPTFIHTEKTIERYQKYHQQHKNYNLYENSKEKLMSYFSSGKFKAFYGLMDISKRVPFLNKDGIHYEHDYYDAIVNLFFQTLCHH
ncbi:unnamed protein product [Owenia fusiformis]|uniref:Uncharacterized protein n=1 Tax=Owenia fusiformis TaxID=6347 RepID=A0A8J1TL01_OWEFU|nr:unnamed protein product [Owenia fusiformis]